MNGIPGRRWQMSSIWWSRNHVGGHRRPRRVRMTKTIFKSCWPWKMRIGCCKEVCLMTTRLLETGPEGPQLGPPWVALSFAPGPHTHCTIQMALVLEGLFTLEFWNTQNNLNQILPFFDTWVFASLQVFYKMSAALLSSQGEAWYDGPSIKRETHLLKHQSTHTAGLYQEDKPLHKTVCAAWYGNNGNA